MEAVKDLTSYKEMLHLLKVEELKNRADEICRNGMPESGLRKEYLDLINAELKERTEKAI